MRHTAMQCLTWGTAAAAVVSALLLADAELPAHRRHVIGLPFSAALPVAASAPAGRR
jgi:hypothetical protein